MGNPTVTPIAELLHDWGFLVSQDNGHRSKEQATLTATKGLAGMVLGMLIAGASATAVANAANTGNGTSSAVTTVSAPTQIGSYDVTFTAATTYTVTAPDGETANGTTGVAFSAMGLGFTITAGGTAFVAGDGFTLTTVDAVGKPTVTSAAKTNTGNGTLGSLTATGYAPTVGIYRLVFIGATQFEVEDPTGKLVGTGVTGTAFSGGGLGFTITAGGTAFVPGDRFAITVAPNAGAGKLKQWNPGAVDGTQTVVGILGATKDATAADKPAAYVSRGAEVNGSELIWPTGANAATIAAGTAQLRSLGILVR